MDDKTFDPDQDIATARTLTYELDLAEQRQRLILVVLSTAMYGFMALVVLSLFFLFYSGYPRIDATGKLYIILPVASFLGLLFLLFCARSLFLIIMDRKAIQLCRLRLVAAVAEADRRLLDV